MQPLGSAIVAGSGSADHAGCANDDEDTARLSSVELHPVPSRFACAKVAAVVGLLVLIAAGVAVGVLLLSAPHAGSTLPKVSHGAPCVCVAVCVWLCVWLCV